MYKKPGTGFAICRSYQILESDTGYTRLNHLPDISYAGCVMYWMYWMYQILKVPCTRFIRLVIVPVWIYQTLDITWTWKNMSWTECTYTRCCRHWIYQSLDVPVNGYTSLDVPCTGFSRYRMHQALNQCIILNIYNIQKVPSTDESGTQYRRHYHVLDTSCHVLEGPCTECTRQWIHQVIHIPSTEYTRHWLCHILYIP